jgi:hypothetical protein
MNRSGLGLAALVALFLLTGVSDANAIWHNDVNDPCPTYDDCTMTGPTETAGPLKDPYVVTCFAVKSNNQACRDCVTQYDDWGQPTGRTVCGYVQYAKGCKCHWQNNACVPMGTCDYYQ